MNPREERENLEQLLVGPYGIRAADSHGRAEPEEECPIRTCFPRDVDRKAQRACQGLPGGC